MDMFHVIYLVTPVWRNGARVFPPVTSVRGPLMQSVVMASLWGLGRCATATREWGALLTQCWADLLPPVLLLIPEVNYDLPIFNNLFGWYLLNLATDKPHNDPQRGHTVLFLKKRKNSEKKKKWRYAHHFRSTNLIHLQVYCYKMFCV